MVGAQAAATTYFNVPAAQKASKYVADITTDVNTGVITMTTAGASSGLPTTAQGMNLSMSPNVNNVALAAGATGAIDWACSSATAQTAQNKGLNSRAIPANPLPAKYAPAECR